MKNKTQLDGMPVWFDGKSINEEMCIRDSLRCRCACSIVPSSEATLGIQKLVIRQIRHDPTSFQKNILRFFKNGSVLHPGFLLLVKE